MGCDKMNEPETLFDSSAKFQSSCETISGKSFNEAKKLLGEAQSFRKLKLDFVGVDLLAVTWRNSLEDQCECVFSDDIALYTNFKKGEKS